MVNRSIFMAAAFVVAIGGAIVSRASTNQITYYDEVTAPGSCSPTSCVTSPLHPQCTQQFWSDNICTLPATPTLYKPN